MKKSTNMDLVHEITFSDLFDIEKIQHLQDVFAETHGVASIITNANGIPITRPSRFTHLCNEIIRKTLIGCSNCYKSDATIGRQNTTGPTIQPCLSGGLWDAGVSITVGGVHVANWLIGQVKNDKLNNEKLMAYAEEIGTNRNDFEEALDEIPEMTLEQFQKVANMLFLFSNELSENAYKNFLLKKQKEQADKLSEELKKTIIDLTKKNKVEEILEYERFLVSMLMDNIQQNIFFKDKQSRFIRISKSHAKYFNLSDPSEALGKTDFDFFSNEHAQQAYNDEQKIIETGQPLFNIEEKETYPDGRIAWVSTSKLPMRNKNGEIVGTMGISENITERKLFEEKLIVEKNLLKALINNIPDQIYYKNGESRFMVSNKALANNFGLSDPDDIIGKSDFDFHDEEHASKYFADEQELLKTGKPMINLENTVFHRHSGKKTIEIITKVPVKDSNGDVIGLVGINRDITEIKKAQERLKESEQKLSTLFSSMTEMVVIHELIFDDSNQAIDYIITDCNDKFLELTGLSKADVIGQLSTQVYKTKEPPYFDIYKKVAETCEPYEYNTYYAPMDKHFMVSVVSPQKNSFATITTDITELVQSKEEMMTKKNELENYLYIASHDLRSPMVNIQGFSQRLQKQSLAVREALATCSIQNETKNEVEKIINNDIPRSLNFILTNVSKMDTLISGLLQLSRTGRVKMNIKKINMEQLLKSIITACNYQLTEIGAQVNIEDLPECYGDENQLNQMFSNLIGNAIKYRSKERALIIRVSGETRYKKVVYKVEDNGIGICAEYLERIWDVFFRVDQLSDESGEGLGLSLAKRIADKNRGKIWAESEEGKGSTFFVELNRKEFSE